MRPELALAALRFDPLLPVWIIGTLAVLAVTITGIAFWRRARGTVLRLLAFAALLSWLAGPRLVQETRETLPDIGLLVVDQSASMRVGGRAALAETARASLTTKAAAFKDLELRTITVPEAGNNGTQLFTVIERALGSIPHARFAGAIVITDGQIHDLPTDSPGPVQGGPVSGGQLRAGQMLGGAPLNLLIPAKDEENDRRVRIIEAPGYGIVGKSVTLRAVIDDLGPSKGRQTTASLTIRRDGEPPDTTRVPVGQEQRIEVPITRAGPTIIELSASPLPGEVSALNNSAVVEINGVRDRLRVLLISGEPHPGERTWRRLLKADPAVDLVHFTILRPPEKDDLTPLNELALIAFPVRELFQEKIGEFDLIILDRFQNRGLLPLPYLTNIANRVRQGGALLLSVGPEFTGPTSLAATPLGAVLPAAPARFNAVIEERFRPLVSALGQRHPVTEGLPGANSPGDPAGSSPRAASWGVWHRHIQADTVRGDVLMESPRGQPLLALDRVGQGRAALLLSDQIWLWSRGHDGGGPQNELLRRIAHWLMREPELEENALTARVHDGHLIVERRALAPAASDAPGGTVEVTDPAGAVVTVPLAETAFGRASASLPVSLPGIWRVSDGDRTAFAAAGAANPLELSDLRATATIAGGLARASGGGIHWLGTVDAPDLPDLRRTEPGRAASGGTWVGLERRHDHVVTGVTSLSLLPTTLSLPLILGLLVLAWRREGR